MYREMVNHNATYATRRNHVPRHGVSYRRNPFRALRSMVRSAIHAFIYETIVV